MPGVARVAVFTAQHAPVHTQADADAGAPGHVGTVVERLAVDMQRTPAALGLERADAIVFHPDMVKMLAQRRLQQCAFPVVGQTALRTREAAANVGCCQFDPSTVENKWTTRRHTHLADVAAQQSCRRRTLVDHPEDLPGQRVVVSALAGRLHNLTVEATLVGNADRDFGAADVDTGNRAHAGRQRDNSRDRRNHARY